MPLPGARRSFRGSTRPAVRRASRLPARSRRRASSHRGRSAGWPPRQRPSKPVSANVSAKQSRSRSNWATTKSRAKPVTPRSQKHSTVRQAPRPNTYGKPNRRSSPRYSGHSFERLSCPASVSQAFSVSIRHHGSAHTSVRSCSTTERGREQRTSYVILSGTPSPCSIRAFPRFRAISAAPERRKRLQRSATGGNGRVRSWAGSSPNR